MNIDQRFMLRPERLYCDSIWARSVRLDIMGQLEQDESCLICPDPSIFYLCELYEWADRDGDRERLKLPDHLFTNYDVCREFMESNNLLPELLEGDELHDALEDAWSSGELRIVEEGYRDVFRENPDMITPIQSVCWPIDVSCPGQCQAVLDAFGGCAILMEFEGDTYLNLTGGGMDLTWDLCRGYALCGCLPPIELARRLPMDRKLTEIDEWVLRCCLYSLQAAQEAVGFWRKDAANLYEKMLRAAHAEVIPDNLPLEAVLDFSIEHEREDLRAIVETPLRYMGRIPAVSTPS